jgi:prolyl 4-hydroxylase
MVTVLDLERQAQTDGNAAMTLAECRLLGVGCEPSQRAAYEAVKLAARHGNPDGRRAWVYLTEAGIGTKANHKAALGMLKELAKEDKFAALQLAFFDHMTCEQRLKEITPKIISQDPYIALYPQLFNAAECKYLAVLGTPWLEKAAVVGATGEKSMNPARDADSSAIPHLTEDMVVQRINRCIATATGTKASWAEPLNLLRYRPGQQYKPHHDGSGAGDAPMRNYTALIWLNEQFEGGETDFPNINVRVRGGVGDMLVFRNVRDDGSPDPRLLHAGLPVTEGVKWMASRWIRGQDYLKG